MHISQKFFIMRDWIFISIPLALKTHIIRMGVQQCHAALLDNPIKFALPNVYVLFAQNPKKSEILGERVRKLYIAASVRTRYPKWKDGAHAVRFRFEGIRFECG